MSQHWIAGAPSSGNDGRASTVRATNGTCARSTFKPRDVEELVDYYLHRPLAHLLVLGVRRTPITANQLTILGGLVGIGAGVAVAFVGPQRQWPALLGAALLFLSILLDCADGQLARVRGTCSLAGRALDGFVDTFPVAAVFLAQIWLLPRFGHSAWSFIPLGVAAGFSFRWQVHSYDHAKNLYLTNMDGDPAHLPRLERIDEELAELRRYRRWLHCVALAAFRAVVRAQHKSFAGSANQLPPIRSEAERQAYRAVFRGWMRAWSFNGLGSHLAMCVAALALTPVCPAAMVVVFWIIVAPLNLLTLLLKGGQPRLAARLRAELSAAAGCP